MVNFSSTSVSFFYWILFLFHFLIWIFLLDVCYHQYLHIIFISEFSYGFCLWNIRCILFIALPIILSIIDVYLISWIDIGAIWLIIKDKSWTWWILPFFDVRSLLILSKGAQASSIEELFLSWSQFNNKQVRTNWIQFSLRLVRFGRCGCVVRAWDGDTP